MNLSESFALEIVNFSDTDLTSEDRSALGHLLLDNAGVSIGGRKQPCVVAAVKWAEASSSSGSACMIGSSARVAPDVAALVNGVAGHSNELDDTHEPSLSHPGCIVITAALATATNSTTGPQFLAAVAAGYETMARLGEAADPPHILHKGFHPTILFGTFGAASAAAKMLGLDVHGLLTAWGHALSLTGGAMQFSNEASGTDVKRMHAGYAARNGVMAAQFSQAGITAPLRPLDGKYGFLHLFGGNTEKKESQLRCRSSGLLAVRETSLKPYSCCRLFHCVIDGLHVLYGAALPQPDDTVEISVKSSKIVAEQHMMRDPKSSMAAQYSLPYSLGATLAFGANAYEAYQQEYLDNPRIRAWAQKVRFEVDPQYEALYPHRFGASVEVRMRSGEVRSTEVLDGYGSPANPMTYPLVRDKARQLIARVDEQLDFSALEDAIEGLVRGGSLIPFRRAYFSTAVG